MENLLGQVVEAILDKIDVRIGKEWNAQQARAVHEMFDVLLAIVNK